MGRKSSIPKPVNKEIKVVKTPVKKEKGRSKRRLRNEIAQLRQKIKELEYPAFKPGFYTSREWRELRYTAIKTMGRKCQACGSSNKEIHVDHIKPRSKFPGLELTLSNLQILCVDCNIGKSNKDDTDWR